MFRLAGSSQNDKKLLQSYNSDNSKTFFFYDIFGANASFVQKKKVMFGLVKVRLD